MTLPDYPDFTRAVTEIERVEQVPVFGADIKANDVARVVDTSRYKSVAVAIDTSGSAAGKRYVLTFSWLDGAQLVDMAPVSFHSQASYLTEPPNTFFLQRNVRAPSLSLFLRGDDNAVVPLAIYGSSRQLPEDTLSHTPTNGRLVMAPAIGAIAAGGTAGPFYCPPVARALSLRLGTTLATITCSVSGVGAPGGVVGANVFGGWVGNAGDFIRNNVVAPGIGTEWTVTNNDTVPRSPTLTVWDVS